MMCDPSQTIIYFDRDSYSRNDHFDCKNHDLIDNRFDLFLLQ